MGLRTWLRNKNEKVGFRSQASAIENGVKPTTFVMSDALKRLALKNVDVGTVIDIGASDGHWAEMSIDAFPTAKHLLVEAQNPHEQALKNFVSKNPQAQYLLAAAGNREGKIYFDASALYGGLAGEKPFDNNCIEVPVHRMDAKVKELGLSGPYLIKLDTHGYEVPILEGCAGILAETNALIIEAYNFQIAENSLLFFELCAYLKDLGFLPTDIVDLMLRPNDHSFWQMDIVFLRDTHPSFKQLTYQ